MDSKVLDDVKEFSPRAFMRKRIWETENLHCNIYCFEPEQQNALHRHPVSDEVVLCWEGAGEVIVGEEHAPIRAGETLLVTMNTPHGFINTSAYERMIITVLQCPLPVEHVSVEPGDIAEIIKG